MRNLWESSNPALQSVAINADDAHHLVQTRPETATMAGVVNRTALLVALAIAAGVGGYALTQTFPAVSRISAIAAFVIVLGMFFIIRGKPTLAPVVGPIYSIVQGVFLGSLTAVLDDILLAHGLSVTGGLALQALIITSSIMVSMLLLYRTGLIKPSRTLRAVLGTLTVGIMITYALSFALSFFGISLPFISVGSALQGGTSAYIGLGLNVLILGVASLWLILDFKLVEDIVESGEPRVMEWYGAFALIVSLAWIYYEAVKLTFRLALLFGNRD